eukprot:scaffold12311_cov70-Isochrysis_galbana.AAC.3
MGWYTWTKLSDCGRALSSGLLGRVRVHAAAYESESTGPVCPSCIRPHRPSLLIRHHHPTTAFARYSRSCRTLRTRCVTTFSPPPARSKPSFATERSG